MKAKPKANVVPLRRKNTAVAIHKPQTPKTLVEVLRDAATDPRVDVAKWDALLSFQERIERREAERAFNVALHSAQQQMPKVLKDRNNPITHSKYATLEKVYDTIMPIASNLGFSLSFSTEQSHLPDHYRMVAELSNGGHSRIYKADIPSDATGMKGTQNKSATQAFGSAMSYGRRYLTLLIFNSVATESEDNDGNTQAASTTIDEEQFKRLEAKIDSYGADRMGFKKYFKIEKIEELPHGKFDQAMKMLDTKYGKKASFDLLD